LCRTTCGRFRYSPGSSATVNMTRRI
jgi:hypothetical protein